jgi:hypothetical protein
MTMKMTRFAAILTVMLVLAGGTASWRANAYDVIPQQAAAPLVPVKVDIVLSRSQGDKKVSSLPYTIWANANEHGNNVSLRLGVDVPVGASLVTSGNENTSGSGRTTTTTSSTTNRVEFRNVGTSIDCLVRQTPDGRFWVRLNVQDSSIFTSDSDARPPLKLADPMAFRTFMFSNELPMRDGQSVQWASATDKITGEILKLDATLTVLK